MVLNVNRWLNFEYHACRLFIAQIPKKCVVPEIITHPKEGHWKFRRGGESQKPKILKDEAKLEIPGSGCGGHKPKTPSVGGMDIFWSYTIVMF